MDQNYQQAMIQALMGAPAMAPGMGAQNPSSPYGATFMTGNMAMPAFMGQGSAGTAQGQPYSTSPQTLQQPYAAYPGMATGQIPGA